YVALLEGNRARVSGAPSLTREPAPSPTKEEDGAGRPVAPAPTEEPRKPDRETPKKPGRAPKDDLGFYID
ncbi:MAG: hypothetical protein V9G98_08690, partial [Candidatus Competibacter sp.]